MRPTFSIICFTVLSGIGYGAWFLLGLGLAIGPVFCGPRSAPGASGVSTTLCHAPFWSFGTFLLAFLLVGIGLLCSLGHLGKPRRAWRALSQWRSSWLSREGVAALATFVPATLLLAGVIVPPIMAAGIPMPSVQFSNWVSCVELSEHALGLVLAAGSLLTVFCTANIYASLKPIRAWHDRHVVPVYLLLALYGGGLLLAIFPMWRRDQPILLAGTIALALVVAWLKHRYWRSIDAQPAISAGRATGLDALGRVHGFEQPNTEENYLTHEMGFVLARKHARKLRSVVLVAAFLLPALLAALALALPATRMVAAWLALASGVGGLFVERWLFFAEAKHAVMAYYAR